MDIEKSISDARAAGHSDEEISQYLLGLPQSKDAVAAGHTAADIVGHFGLKVGNPSPPPAPSAEPAVVEQRTGPTRLPLIAGSSAVKGAASTLGLPGLAQHALAPLIASITPEPPATPPLGSRWMNASSDASRHIDLPTSNELTERAKAAGITDRPDLAPQTPVENLVAGTAEGAGGGLVMGMPVLGALAGAASEGTHQLMPDSKIAPIIAGVAAGGVAQGVKSALAGNAMAGIAKQMGTSGTLQEAGEALQAGARDWLTNELPRKLDKIWTPINNVMAGKPVSLPNFTNEVRGMVSKGGPLQEFIADLSPKLAETWNKRLNNLLSTPTWENAKEFRSVIGDAMSNPMVLKDLPAEQMSKLYAAVTKDMGAAADGVSRVVGDSFKNANAASSKLYQFAEQRLGKIVSGPKGNAKDIDPEVAASRWLGGGSKGGSGLGELREAMPHAVDELAAAHLRSADPAKAWSKLSPEAQQALVPNGDHRVVLDKASKIALAPKAALSEGTNKLAGLGLGHAVGTVLGKVLGMEENSLVSGATGEILGYAAPLLYQAAKHVTQNPLLLTEPAAGGALAAQGTRR